MTDGRSPHSIISINKLSHIVNGKYVISAFAFICKGRFFIFCLPCMRGGQAILYIQICPARQ